MMTIPNIYKFNYQVLTTDIRIKKGKELLAALSLH
jgi:hypothetical protein